MKDSIKGLCVAFSLYSAIPMPQVEWNKKTMRYALAFLPWIGLIIAGLQLIWHWFCVRFDASALLYSIFAAFIPLVVSGGIHLDGFTDTCDALCSFGSQEKKLEILKDPHVGAFGVMWQSIFLLTQVALFAQIYEQPGLLPAAVFGFAAARALGGRAIVAVACAKTSGLAHLFAEGSEKRAVSRVLCAEFLLLIGVMVAIHAIFGLAFMAFSCLGVRLHRKFCSKLFGGITGDLAGFLISLIELFALFLAAFGGLIA